MRIAILIVSLLLLSPALAQDWRPYENARFGFSVEIPAGFDAEEEAANGDGRVFRTVDGGHVLRAYGGNIVEGSFAALLRSGAQSAREAAWDVSYERITDDWASYSGLRDGRIFYAHAIALCDGTQYATYELDYPAANDRAVMDRVIRRLNDSLEPTGSALSC